MDRRRGYETQRGFAQPLTDPQQSDDLAGRFGNRRLGVSVYCVCPSSMELVRPDVRDSQVVEQLRRRARLHAFILEESIDRGWRCSAESTNFRRLTTLT